MNNATRFILFIAVALALLILITILLGGCRKTHRTTTHSYLSTACLHEAEDRRKGDIPRATELHAHCSAMVGYAGVKRPAQCKWCDATCQCPQHQDDQT